MKTFFKKLTTLRYDQRAVTALEYALIAALIAAVIVGAVTSLGTSVNSAFTTVAGDFGTK